MPAQRESSLETGYWDDFQPEVKLAPHRRLARGAGELLRPSLWTRASGSRKPLGRTAYLDGLRGFAAFIVYWQHHELWAHTVVESGTHLEQSFGFEGRYYLACFHGLRTFFTGGHFAVTVFFVISGYVLSAKSLSLIQAGEHGKLGDTLASAFFRRWMRLYIPVVCVTFLYMTSWHLFGLWTDDEHEPNYRAELWKFYAEFKNFSFIFNGGGTPWFSYDAHSWSIPVEFRGSIVTYTTLLAFSRCRRNARLWCEVGLIFYFMYIADGAFNSMFVGGMLLCDLDLLALNNDLPEFFSKMEPYKEFIHYHLFVIGIYLGGVPSQSGNIAQLKASPGWYFLSFLKPQAVFDYKWFYLFWAAMFMVASSSRIPWLKRFFETRFNQYLGRISFAFYLVHGPVLRILGDRLYTAAGWTRQTHALGLPGWIGKFPLPKAGPVGLELNFLLPHLILLPLTLWLAEIATKLIDKPSVKFAQWAYQKTLAPSVKS